ncbi:cytochrome b [Streptomyces sp. NPDC012508]|uniref:cytochrome b n=1 Tax=Streptomyces sp. NPDC012508 TaxID=3364837 RepID=UPI0036BC252E
MTTPPQEPVRLRNGPWGYGLVTKVLHWSTAAAMAAQFTIGYLLADVSSGHGRGRGQGSGSGHGRGRGGEYDAFGDDPLFTAHVLLGLTVLALGLLRLGWRIATPLPPWAPTLSPFERSLAHWTEYALLALTLVVPASGLWLLASGDDDLLGVHITAHVLFFAALALHVGLVARHQLFVRDRLLGRML